MRGNHNGIKDILEPSQLRHGFLLRSAHDLMRSSLGDNAPALQHNHAFSQSEDLLAAMGHVKDGNTMCLVPRS